MTLDIVFSASWLMSIALQEPPLPTPPNSYMTDLYVQLPVGLDVG